MALEWTQEDRTMVAGVLRDMRDRIAHGPRRQGDGDLTMRIGAAMGILTRHWSGYVPPKPATLTYRLELDTTKLEAEIKRAEEPRFPKVSYVYRQDGYAQFYLNGVAHNPLVFRYDCSMESIFEALGIEAIEALPPLKEGERFPEMVEVPDATSQDQSPT